MEVDSENEPCEEMAPPILTSGAANAAILAQSTSVKQEMANVDHLPLAKMKYEPIIEDTSGCGAQTAIKSEEKATNHPGRRHVRRRFATKTALPFRIEIDANIKMEVQEDQQASKSEAAINECKHEVKAEIHGYVTQELAFKNGVNDEFPNQATGKRGEGESMSCSRPGSTSGHS